MSGMFDKLKDDPRWKQLHVGVRENGTCEYTHIETYMKLPMAVLFSKQYGYAVDHENRFIGFTIDNGGTDIEVRLPFETVELMAKWISNPPPAPVPEQEATLTPSNPSRGKAGG